MCPLGIHNTKGTLQTTLIKTSSKIVFHRIELLKYNIFFSFKRLYLHTNQPLNNENGV